MGSILAPVVMLSTIIFNDGVSQMKVPFQSMDKCMDAATTMVKGFADVQRDGNSIRAVQRDAFAGRIVIRTIVCAPT